MRLALSRPGRPLWLITLADLALLLVGFFVFLQATSYKPKSEQTAIQAGIREAFGGAAAARLAVDANVIAGFPAGSARLPRDIAAMKDWARGALADPRTHLVVTGFADGTSVDQLDGSSLALAGLRADTIVTALHGVIPRDRIRLGADVVPGARRVILAISYDP